MPKKCPWPLSHRLKKQIRRVAVLHTRIVCQRKDQLRKIARYIEQHYRLAAIEEHGIEFMRRNRRLARAVSDVAPGMLKQLLQNAPGERYIPTSNQRKGIGGNSQTCLCGHPVPKSLKDRWHNCPKCGLSLDRDVCSAKIVELIAFGSTEKISEAGRPQAGPNPASGQDVVRRGADKGTGVNALGLGWAPNVAPAEESAVKRRSSAKAV